MALFDMTCNLGLASVTFTYDDSIMKLVSIAAVNNSGNRLAIDLIAPLVWSRTLAPTETVSYAIPGGLRPSYSIQTAAIGGTMVSGINWRATLGS